MLIVEHTIILNYRTQSTCLINRAEESLCAAMAAVIRGLLSCSWTALWCVWHVLQTRPKNRNKRRIIRFANIGIPLPAKTKQAFILPEYYFCKICFVTGAIRTIISESHRAKNRKPYKELEADPILKLHVDYTVSQTTSKLSKRGGARHLRG